MKTYTRGQSLEVVPRIIVSAMDKAAIKAFSDIEYTEMCLEAFRFALNGARDQYDRSENWSSAIEVISGKLHTKLANQYSNLFMWGTINNNPIIRQRAKNLAYKRFLQDSNSLNNLFGYSGRYADEKALRTELHKQARTEQKRHLLMSERSMHKDISNLKKIIEDQKIKISQLEHTLQTVNDLS